MKTPWFPYEFVRLWMPVQRTAEGVQAQGLSGFHTREMCQAECDRRNAEVLGEAKANIQRLERELAEWREINRAHDAELAASAKWRGPTAA